MKIIKKIALAASLVIAISATATTAFAETAYKTPAEALAGVTGKTAEQIVELRESGKTYGMIAEDADKLTEFKEAVLEMHTATFTAQVKAGTITQDKADSLIKSITDRHALCDGTGSGSCYKNSTSCDLCTGVINNDTATWSGHRSEARTGHHGRGYGVARGYGNGRHGHCAY